MEYVLHILVMVGIYAILTLSLNLAVGFTGLSVLGHAAFFCAGAYTSALLTLNWGWPAWLALPLAGVMAAILGLLIGYPSLRVKGDYFALTTFGFGIIVYAIAKNWIGLTRGPLGLPGIPPFEICGIALSSSGSYLLLVALVVALTYFLLRRIVESPYGRVLTGIREDEIAAMALGKDTLRYKLQALTIAALFAGLAGSLYAHHITFIDPSSFTVNESIAILLMVVLGGMGSLPGSVLGAAVLVVLPEALRFVGLPSSVAAPLRQMIYGLLLIMLMMFRPQGILGRYKWQ